MHSAFLPCSLRLYTGRVTTAPHTPLRRQHTIVKLLIHIRDGDGDQYLCCADFRPVLICVDKCGINTQVQRRRIEISIAFQSLALIDWVIYFRLLLVDLHHHIPEGNAVTQLLSTDRVQVYVFRRCVVRRVNKHLGNFLEIGLERFVDKPHKVPTWRSQVSNVCCLLSGTSD